VQLVPLKVIAALLPTGTFHERDLVHLGGTQLAPRVAKHRRAMRPTADALLFEDESHERHEFAAGRG